MRIDRGGQDRIGFAKVSSGGLVAGKSVKSPYRLTLSPRQNRTTRFRQRKEDGPREQRPVQRDVGGEDLG
jgi:hypothetical protein